MVNQPTTPVPAAEKDDAADGGGASVGAAAGWAGNAALLVAIAAGVGVLLYQARPHLPFMSDDAFISLRYAQRLLEGHGLTWTAGPRVEGYTNLLWLLACAGLGALGVDLVDAARVLGVLAMAGALVAVAFVLRPRRFGEVVPPLAATVGLALTGTFAVWAIGGLEQPFVACFLAWSIALLQPTLQEERLGVVRVLLAGLMLGLLCLSRADGPVLCVAVGVGLLAALKLSSRAWKSVLLLAVVPLVLTGGHVLFRYLYYGDFVPNSARVKVAFSTHRVAMGSAYVWNGALTFAPMVLSAIAAALVCARHAPARRRVAFLAVIPVVWLAYVAFVGGDIFPARRQWAAPLIPIAILAGELLRYVNGRPAWGRAAATALAAGVVTVTGFQQTASSDPEVFKARWERWEWDGLAVGELLRAAFEEQ
ncbi:MAG TPA: hypothetical protein PKC49_10345 [Phycisphaerae bacterium]|nr:hypothetical protein [Phycisphaerae bacterium]